MRLLVDIINHNVLFSLRQVFEFFCSFLYLKQHKNKAKFIVK